MHDAHARILMLGIAESYEQIAKSYEKIAKWAQHTREPELPPDPLRRGG
jgi:hypothetical protein